MGVLPVKSFIFYAVVLVFLSSCGGGDSSNELLNQTQQADQNSVEESLPVIGSIVRIDPRVDGIIPHGAKLEILANGHEWTEGPLWVPALQAVLYSDIPKNAIYRWSENTGASLWLACRLYR